MRKRMQAKHKSPTKVTLPQISHTSEAPTKEYVYSHIPPVVSKHYTTYQEPYYSNPADVPAKPKVFSGREFRLSSKSAQFLKPVESNFFRKQDEWENSTITEWEFAAKPPSPASIRQWIHDQENKSTAELDLSMEIDQADISQVYFERQTEHPWVFSWFFFISWKVHLLLDFNTV